MQTQTTVKNLITEDKETYFNDLCLKEELETIEENHEKIRTVLIESGNVEYGDCIIDDICEVLNYPTTLVYYDED